MQILKVLILRILLIKLGFSFIDIKSFVQTGSFPGNIFRSAIVANSANTLYASLLENGKEVINKYSIVSETLILDGQLVI